MKKLLFLLAATASAATITTASAQTNPLDLVPNEKGQTVVSKCYDAEGNLHATMQYEIAGYSQEGNEHGGDLEIVFVMTDTAGEVIDHGTIYAFYDGDNLNLSMSNRPETTDVESYLSLNTKLMNDFLDYPDPFPGNDPIDNSGPFRFEGANYSIKTGSRARDMVDVEVYDREARGTEKVKTPAGEFDASKVTFAMDVYDRRSKSRETYKGTEWFSVGEGIVRTEITDRQGNMVDYAEITEISSRRQ